MSFCPNCGNNLEENVKFCPSCGAKLNDNAEPIVVENIMNVENKARSLNVGMLVWSIINILMCCMPLGVVALIFTILAKDAATDEVEQKNIKIAKTCNLIGNIAVGVLVIIYITLMVIGLTTATIV